jgi:hypothetical protein
MVCECEPIAMIGKIPAGSGMRCRRGGDLHIGNAEFSQLRIECN